MRTEKVITKKKKIIKIMVKIYQPEGLDWAQYAISSENPLTHYYLKTPGGPHVAVDNTALVTRYTKKQLLALSRNNPELFAAYNDMFQIINEMKMPLSFEFKQMMHGLKNRMQVSLDRKAIVIPSWVGYSTEKLRRLEFIAPELYREYYYWLEVINDLGEVTDEIQETMCLLKERMDLVLDKSIQLNKKIINL